MKKTLFCDDWLFCQEGKDKIAISVPHDAMQVQGRDADAPSGSGGGFFRGGAYTYEKKLWAPQEWRHQDMILEFEGVYPNAEVYLNDVKIGGCSYGYSFFRVPLTQLKYNAHNDLRVAVDNSAQPNSRWYSGAGIYRPVWLWSGPKTHIEPDGIRVTTLSTKPAQIHVEVCHTKAQARPEDIRIEIYFGGHLAASAMGNNATLTIPDGKLWDADSPNLYQCVVTLLEEGEALDSQCTSFGIRKVAWSPRGLSINGKNVLLKGGCIHHDHGILGARSFDKSEWRRLKRLKDNGFNAIRSSHNPAGRAVLEACDALGLYVMDETWDMWDKAKNPHDYARDFMAGYENDISAIVAKDYNHPSVIMYSIGNEVTEPATAAGVEIAAKIKEKFHTLDQTRPITAGINLTLLFLATLDQDVMGGGAPPVTEMNSTAYNKMVSEMGQHLVMAAATPEADKVASPVLDLLDIAGYNYAASRYAMDSELHPDRLIVGTESYVHDLPHNWRLVETLPNVIGDFMWTAWDYLGEAGIGAWSYDSEDMTFGKKYPWLLADAGAFDILGNESAQSGMAAVVWGQRKSPYIGVRPVNHPGVEPNMAIWRGTNGLPYWSYQGCDGNPAYIEVYTQASEVGLFVNGALIQRSAVKDFKAEFHTVYVPGELKAVAYNADGSVHSESCLISADDQTRICITPEEERVCRGDILYVDISLTGGNGQIECNRDTKLHLSVDGGELLAFGSANPKTEDNFLDGEYTTYYGRSQAVIKALGQSVTIHVSGSGLADASKTIQIAE